MIHEETLKFMFLICLELLKKKNSCCKFSDGKKVSESEKDPVWY